MRGWIDLMSDVNWVDYHGMWGRKATDGSWYVLRWTNLVDAMGERDVKAGGYDVYECDVKRIDLREIGLNETPNPNAKVMADRTKLDNALCSCGMRREGANLVDGRNDVIDPKCGELAMVEACISYGLGAPLESFAGSKRPLSIRAQARRYAEELMCDGAKLRDRLERPVNAIMTSAEDYGNGKIGL